MLQPDKGAAVPKFGDWDVSNPASADGYTHIFNKVREERQGGAGHAPGTPNERPHVIRNQAGNGKAQVCLQFLFIICQCPTQYKHMVTFNHFLFF